MAQHTGMNIMTVGRIVEDLISRGILQERGTEAGSQAGRPPRLLSLDRDRLLCVSLFLDRDMLHLGVVDPVGQMRVYEALPVPEGDFLPGRVVHWMADCLGYREGRDGVLRQLPVGACAVAGAAAGAPAGL